MKQLVRIILTLLAGACVGSSLAASRPNVVWILSEDNSKHFLELFDAAGAPTPNIERLAAHGLKYSRAFSCSPVCSVARTTLMTGLFAPRVGTQFHRKIKPAQLPEGWEMFPAYLRRAGYYTSNHSKTDYNTRGNEGVWDESSRQASWRKRPSKETPFFHMQTFATTHESSLHFSREEIERDAPSSDPGTMELADYHPDTPLFRLTYARYHDRIARVDEQVGELVELLEEDGLLEDTFIFYFGDHGGVLPGSKGYLRETGLHVPLAVRVPENWKDLAGSAGLGGEVSGFVSFADFGPTALRLAGVEVPAHMDGRAFLGRGVSTDEVNQRDEAFGYADRFDEKYELVRSLRKGRHKYVRHYQGFYPDALQNNYRYRMLAYEEWRDLFRKGKLTPEQRLFFEAKPAEALYDIETDPYEVRNLADDPEHSEILKALRNRLHAWVTGMPDLSFYPESFLVEKAMDSPAAFGRERKGEIARLADTADLATLPISEALPRLERALRAENRWVRYWALIDCAVFGKAASQLAEESRRLLEDPEPLVRLRAAEFLGSIGAADPRPTIRAILRNDDSPVVALIALNAVVYLQDGPEEWRFDLSPDDVRAKNGEVERRLDYLTK